MTNLVKLFDGSAVELTDSLVKGFDGRYIPKEFAIQVQGNFYHREYHVANGEIVFDHSYGFYRTYSNFLADGIVDVVDGKAVRGFFTAVSALGYSSEEGIPFLNTEVITKAGYTMCERCCCVYRINNTVDFRGSGFTTNLVHLSCTGCGCGSSSREHRAGYHSLARLDMSRGSRFKVGMEVEKEDGDVLKKLNSRKHHDNYGWCLERDSSLNDRTGFECVSPVLDLMSDVQLEAHMAVMSDIINAKYTTSCGGHIHVSDTSRDPSVLFDDCAGYFPLLYALYPARSKRSYSFAVKACELKRHSKYAVMLHNHTVEFRIFPSPKNVDTQRWRIHLLRIILRNPAKTVDKVLDMMLDTESELFRHLAVGYDTVEKYVKKIKLVIEMSKNIEGIDLTTDLPAAEKKIGEFLSQREQARIAAAPETPVNELVETL